MARSYWVADTSQWPIWTTRRLMRFTHRGNVGVDVALVVRSTCQIRKDSQRETSNGILVSVLVDASLVMVNLNK